MEWFLFVPRDKLRQKKKQVDLKGLQKGNSLGFSWIGLGTCRPLCLHTDCWQKNKKVFIFPADNPYIVFVPCIFIGAIIIKRVSTMRKNKREGKEQRKYVLWLKYWWKFGKSGLVSVFCTYFLHDYKYYDLPFSLFSIIVLSSENMNSWALTRFSASLLIARFIWGVGSSVMHKSNNSWPERKYQNEKNRQVCFNSIALCRDMHLK